MANQQQDRDRVGEGLVSYADAAEYLGVCRDTIRNLVDRGELPRARIGRKAVRIPKRALVEFANRSLVRQ